MHGGPLGGLDSSGAICDLLRHKHSNRHEFSRYPEGLAFCVRQVVKPKDYFPCIAIFCWWIDNLLGQSTSCGVVPTRISIKHMCLLLLHGSVSTQGKHSTQQECTECLPFSGAPHALGHHLLLSAAALMGSSQLVLASACARAARSRGPEGIPIYNQPLDEAPTDVIILG